MQIAHLHYSRHTSSLIKRKRIWKRKYIDWIRDDALAVRALRTPKYAVAGLVWAPWRRSSNGSGKFRAKHKWTWGLCLILSLGL
jgi:hypothetical protein